MKGINPVSIINDLAFEKLRKTLHSKQKQLKKKGKGNKPHASVALREDEIKILYEKGLLGVSGVYRALNLFQYTLVKQQPSF